MRRPVEALSVSLQLVVQLGELAQEAVVGSDVPVLAAHPHGHGRGQADLHHEVGEGDGAGPRHAHQTVDEHLP